MTILAQAFGTLTVTADDTPSQAFDLFVEDPDAPFIELTVTERAAVAASQRDSMLGVSLDRNRGDGVMIPISDRELAGVFTITEDAEMFGDLMKFSVSGPQYSPFGASGLRFRGNVRAEVVYGFGVNEYRAHVFDGFVISAPFSDPPPAADVTCGDAATLYAERRAKDWTLPEFSNRTRLDITLELLGIGEIPTGRLDVGEDGGGRINKAYALGDEPIVSWLQKFWRVRGREVGFIAGVFVIVNVMPGSNVEPAVAIITPANTIPPYTLDAPTTLEPNVHGVVAVTVTRQDSLVAGAPTVLLTTIDAPYAPAGYVAKQINGVLTEETYPTTEAFRRIYELRNSTTKLGTVDIRVEEEEKSMYALRGTLAQLVQVAGLPLDDFDIEPFNPGTAYIYEDGSTRAEPVETLQVTRRMLRVKDVDANNNVVFIREERRLPRFYRRATFENPSGDDIPLTPYSGRLPLSDDGNGVNAPFIETLELPAGLTGSATEITITTYDLNDDETIKHETVTEYVTSIGEKLFRAEDRFGYGVDEQKTWTAFENELVSAPLNELAQYRGRKITRKSYRVINEDLYAETETIIENGKTILKPERTVTGSLPTPEKAEPTTTQQEIRAITKDGERIAYADGEEIEITEHNEFIQDDDEAAFYSRFLAREAAAITLILTMPIEAQIHKWKSVVVDLPGASADDLTFFVRQITRDVARFSQQIVAKNYPPELS